MFRLRLRIVDGGIKLIRAALIPIRAYRIVHTMGNSAAGGDRGGCCTVVRKDTVPARLRIPEIRPIASDSRIQNT